METSDQNFKRRLEREWARAVQGKKSEQRQWEIIDGGEWNWTSGGARVSSAGSEWSSLGWLGWNGVAATQLKNFVIELTISGTADAAGFSFGPYKDFLCGVDEQSGTRRLQLEVDVEAGSWAFRVDGRLQQRCWWDAAVTGVEEILHGKFMLKARNAREVLYRQLSLHILEASCQLSIVVTCYRFLQRLRVSLKNWCHQEMPSGTYEVLVVNPGSPDGTHEHLAAVARSYPHVRVRELAVDSQMAMNKGAMINQAFSVARGEWLWLTDADCVFGPNTAATVMEQIRGKHNLLFYGERRFLTPAQTDALLSGRADPLRDFERLAAEAGAGKTESFHWGYTQIIHRSTLAKVRYDEGFNHFAHSDGMFAETCKRMSIMPTRLEGLFCLHLDHPFSWYGAEVFL